MGSLAELSRAVFLSYASQDADAARRICEALRAGGIEVWFDQSELRGGDAWDRQIRKQIHDCALFIPIISAHSQSRLEGYFRREWKLAAERTHDMAEEKAFLVPVVIDDTSEKSASVPDRFREVQWTRLPAGEILPAFVERITRLLSSGPTAPAAERHVPLVPAAASRHHALTQKSLAVASLIATLGVIVAGYFALDKLVLSKRPVAENSGSATVAGIATTTAAPEKSIAVLPFADMSEKKDQEYFSDGLSEELIDRLTKITDLRVPARTSSFYFKGKNETLATIAKELRVAHLLEGSVRKAGNRLRVSAQLLRADTGYHLWTETYDRDTKDIFKVQDEIAAAVVKALSVSLLKAPVSPGARTSNTPAYVLYLQGRSRFSSGNSLSDNEQAIAILEQASKLDPGFAPTWATLSRARLVNYLDYHRGSPEQVRTLAMNDADRAISIDPTSSEGHVMRGRVLMTLDLNWADAEREMARALELDSTNADVLRNAAYFSISQGRFDEAVLRVTIATELDPLSFYNYMRLGLAEYCSGMPAKAEASYRTALALQSNVDELHSDLAMALVAQGKVDEALVEIDRESEPIYRALTRPIVLNALGRSAEAEQALAETVTKYGEGFPYSIGIIYAERRDLTRAFEWWQKAIQNHDPDAAYFAKSIPNFVQMPKIAGDVRYKAMLRKLNLPE